MDFKLGKYIEKGKFGRIYIDKNDKTKVIKLINKNKCKSINLYKEIQILETINCDFVVKFFGWEETEQNLVQKLEYMPGGDLFQKIESNNISEDFTIDCIKQITLAVNYLHKRKILHRDIKPENVLLDEKGKIKLIDFGFAVFFTEYKKKYKILGTAFYMAPEMLDEVGYDYKIDIWAVGIIFYELLFGELPFGGNNTTEIFNKICNGKFSFPRENNYANIIKHILTIDPNKRATCLDILSKI